MTPTTCSSWRADGFEAFAPSRGIETRAYPGVTAIAATRAGRLAFAGQRPDDSTNAFVGMLDAP
ncbi:MAG TPA: hypothetical protein VMJ10_01835 [Kofleriaceae bacterium]|nr:hypothetical protein [Kofleriaceae bacterium]